MNKLYILIFLSMIACTVTAKNTKYDIRCEDDSEIYLCNIFNDSEKYNVKVKKYFCPYFDINVLNESDVLQVNCSPPKNVSKFFYYKKSLNHDWLLFKYEYISSMDVDEDISINIYSNKTLSESFQSELPVQNGIINKKSYLFKNEYIETKMYLVKGDNVLISEEKTDRNTRKWYFIHYKGKKEINMWIKANDVDVIE